MFKFTLLTLLASTTLSACVDHGAEGEKKEAEHQKSLEASARADFESWTKDPLAMQLRSLHEIREGVCGEVNLKDDNGRYKGFHHFLDRPKFNGPPEQNPSVADPSLPISLKGTADVSRLCMTPLERKAYEATYALTAAEFKRRMNRKYEQENVEYLQAVLRSKELDGGSR